MKQLLWINRWNERRKNSAKENQNIGYNFIINYTLNKYNRVFSDLCMGLRMNEGSQTSRYITFIPEKNNEVIKLRISNHPSTIEEWGSKELTGLPNRRYSIVIFSSKSMPNESKQHIKETEWRSYLSQGIPVYEKCFNSLYLNETIQKLLTILKTIYNGGNPEDTSLAININENKEYKTNKNMSNNKIRITENELKQIVAESVKKVLNENYEIKQLLNNLYDWTKFYEEEFDKANISDRSGDKYSMWGALREMQDIIGRLYDLCLKSNPSDKAL